MKRITQQRRAVSARGGSTLTEVLVSVMVLAIGVTSVMTLFPLSILRAVRANHITHSTIHRYNAETLVTALDLTNYYLFFGADRAPGNTGIDDDVDGNIDQIGMSTPPVWDLDEYLPNTTDDVRHVVIDPLGFYLVAENDNSDGTFDSTQVNFRNFFGGPGSTLRRVSGGHPGNNGNMGLQYNFTRREADDYVTLPDQYTTVIDVALTTPPAADNLDLPNSVDAAILDEIAVALQQTPAATAAQQPARAKALLTLFGTYPDSVRITAVTREILHEDLNGNMTLDPGEDLDVDTNFDLTGGRHIEWASTEPLPTNFTAERAVVQLQNFDFTWMITAVAAPPAQVAMDVVVFQGRQFGTEDERILSANYTNGSPPTVTLNFTGNRPFAKKGSFLLDAENCQWYRITNIPNETTTSLQLTLDRRIIDLDADGQFFVAFPRGVVDVYPIGKK